MPHDFAYPRPEYPRPDRQRGTLEGVDWLNLNGPWQFRFDPDHRGEEQGWHAPSTVDWREQIIVPFCWESLAAWGEGDAAGNENYYSTRVFRNPLEVTRSNHRSAPRYEVGWYRRTIHIPDSPHWHGKRVILTIGAADFFTDCWCNGRHLGHHEGGYTPFEFDLTDALDSSGNGHRTGLIVLRVEDPMDNHEQPVGKQWRWYTTVSGIWQTIYVEPRNASFIENLRIVTDIESGTAQFWVKCADAEGLVISAHITPPKGDPQQATFAVKQRGEARESVIISPVLLWNPNEPHLYNTVLELQRGKEVLDRVQTYFGMRKIDFAPAEEAGGAVALRLNNRARYLRGALHQSYYPEGVYTAGEVATLKNDIVYAKRAGFNFLRIHIKIDDPLLLYWADRLGMLIMADFPNFGEGGDTELGRRRFEQMMREAIDRDFNHPAIFAWCMFNETWGFGGQSEFVNLIHPLNPKDRSKPIKIPGAVSAATEGRASVPASAENGNITSDDTNVAVGISASATAVATKPVKPKLANLSSHAWVQSMWELAKKIDPTRLIEDMSVCHWEHLDYFAHGDTDINSWHFYIDDYDRAREHIHKIVEATYVGSTFNYVPGYQHKGQPLINSEYGGVGALDGDRDISWSFKFLTNELRRYEQISAYIFTELHDVEWEHNGFLNYDRTPKDFGYDPSIINESDTLPMDAPPVSKHAPGETVRVPVASSHYSSKPHKHVTLRWRVGGIDTAGQLHQNLAAGSVPIKFPHRRVAPAHTIELKLPDRPMLCNLLVEACRSDGLIVARNFVHFLVWNGYPPAREDIGRSLILRGYPADWAGAEWSGGSGSRDEERAFDSCYGTGHGFFEWMIPLGDADLTKAQRLKVLCEASSHRIDTPQTDYDLFPTTLQMELNGVRVYNATLRNHPHDARGILSYWRRGKGAYGYLAHAYVEGELLHRVIVNSNGSHLRMRCLVPPNAIPQGGLTIYGAECGRYPVCPLAIIDW